MVSSSSRMSGAVDKVKTHGLKYSAVSVVNVLFGQGLLFLFHTVLGWPATRSNVLSVCLGAIPSYYLNRAWVWGRRGRSHFVKEVLPFWVFAIAGLFASTLFVSIATQFTDISIVANIASLLAWGILWILRFFVLDTVFHVAHIDPDAIDDDEVPEGSEATTADPTTQPESASGTA
ncbi:MAG: GtrA family protein [Acidimicrobiales bacterium]|jgi:putative flippase GtrA|nr:GtrA family protein [Acidimicrobiales bacterium]